MDRARQTVFPSFVYLFSFLLPIRYGTQRGNVSKSPVNSHTMLLLLYIIYAISLLLCYYILYYIMATTVILIAIQRMSNITSKINASYSTIQYLETLDCHSDGGGGERERAQNTPNTRHLGASTPHPHFFFATVQRNDYHRFCQRTKNSQNLRARSCDAYTAH